MRFTVRRLMIAVAITVALLPLAAGVAWLLSPEQARRRALISAYEARAAHHAELERKFARLSKFSDDRYMIAIRGGQLVHIPIAQRPELVPKYLELAQYHDALREKYENTTWHHRRAVEPDPPPPDP
jgi:hypothetical protein